MAYAEVNMYANMKQKTLKIYFISRIFSFYKRFESSNTKSSETIGFTAFCALQYSIVLNRVTQSSIATWNAFLSSSGLKIVPSDFLY